MTRWPLPLLLAALLALPAGSAGFGQPAPEAPSAYASVDGVTYYLAAGRVNGSALAHDAGAGERLLDFQGCSIAQFRPAFGRGRLAIDGVLDGAVPLKLEMSEFEVPGGGVAANVTLDAAHDAALPAGGQARAELAATGLAEMHAATVAGDDGRPVLGNFTDPLTGETDLRASLYVTRDGSRADDGALQPQVTRGDEEMHVVVQSDGGSPPQPAHVAFAPPPGLPDGSAFPDSEHAATYAFRDERYGGTAKVTVASTSKAPPGSNDLAVAVYAPDGFEAANTTVSSSLLGDGRAEMEVPLDQFGDYSIAVHGRLLMGTYRIDVELVPPPAFRLDFWWESVERGDAARPANSECLKDLGLRSQVVSTNVVRHPPPGFPMELVVLAAAVSAAAGLFLVKLGYETFSSAEFKRSFKK